VSNENKEGSKVASNERFSFKDMSAWSFLHFQLGSIFKCAKMFSATYNREKLVFFP
jgi:hypothetical protein